MIFAVTSILVIFIGFYRGKWSAQIPEYLLLMMTIRRGPKSVKNRFFGNGVKHVLEAWNVQISAYLNFFCRQPKYPPSWATGHFRLWAHFIGFYRGIWAAQFWWVPTHKCKKSRFCDLARASPRPFFANLMSFTCKTLWFRPSLTLWFAFRRRGFALTASRNRDFGGFQNFVKSEVYR